MQEYSPGVPAFFISHGFILLLAGNTKHNLFRVFCVIRGFFSCLRQEIFGGNLFKEVAYARNNLKFREASNKIFNENLN